MNARKMLDACQAREKGFGQHGDHLRAFLKLFSPLAPSKAIGKREKERKAERFVVNTRLWSKREKEREG